MHVTVNSVKELRWIPECTQWASGFTCTNIKFRLLKIQEYSVQIWTHSPFFNSLFYLILLKMNQKKNREFRIKSRKQNISTNVHQHWSMSSILPKKVSNRLSAPAKFRRSLKMLWNELFRVASKIPRYSISIDKLPAGIALATVQCAIFMSSLKPFIKAQFNNLQVLEFSLIS